MDLTLKLFLSAGAVPVLADLLTGLAQGRLRLLGGDKAVNPRIYWGYTAVEAALVALVASLWA